MGQRHGADVDGPRRRTAGRDLRRGPRRLQHPILGQLFRVRVAGGVAAQHAHAQAQRHAAPDGADAAVLQDEVGAAAVLEVEVGVVAARAQRRGQQPFGQTGVDRVQRRSCDCRLIRRTGGAHERAPPAEPARPLNDFSDASTASAAWRISSSRPAQPDPADGAESDHLQKADPGPLLRFVGGQRRVAGGLNLERVKGLTLQQHLSVSHPVDHGRLVTVDASDDFPRQYARRQPIGLGDAQLRQDGRRGSSNLALVEGV